MPIKEYECSACGATREHYLRTTEADPTQCPGCEEEDTLSRVMSSPAPHRVGGVDGKQRTAKKIKTRNATYHQSSRGREEHRHNVRTANKRVGLF